MDGRRISLALISLLGWACGCSEELAAVRVVAESGEELLSVRAEIAATADERRLGLRGRAPLGPGEGLLIELPATAEVCIVNDGVHFAIDAVFAQDSGVIAAVERDIAADSSSARCHPEVRRVLELAAGATTRVRAADRLIVE